MDDAMRIDIKKAAQRVAKNIGKLLQQTYQQHDGVWWLCTLGKQMRPLTSQEIQWHVERNHAPFVKGGVTPDDDRWWDERASPLDK